MAHGAGHRHHDVGALVDEVGGVRLAVGHVLEVAREGAGLRVLVPAQDLDVLVLDLVVVLHAAGEPSMKMVTVGISMPP
ncbi:hypothetical protein ACNQUF_11975 [Corynebacterium diphtheriae]